MHPVIAAFLVTLTALLACAAPARAGESRLGGDVGSAAIADLVAVDDGGWAAVFVVPGAAGRWEDAVVLRAGPDDAPQWAFRLRGRRVLVAQPLPGGGLLLGGDRGWLARVKPDGSLAWQVEFGVEARVTALSCVGWSCACGGASGPDAFVARIDAAADAVIGSHAIRASAGITSLALLPSGVLAAGVMAFQGGDLPDAVVAVVDGADDVAWSATLAASFTEITLPAAQVHRVAWMADGALFAGGSEQDGIGRLAVFEPDGALRHAHLRGLALLGLGEIAVLPSGEALVVEGSRLTVVGPSLDPVRARGFADPLDWTPQRLAVGPGGEVLALFGQRVVRLDARLEGPAACPSMLDRAAPRGLPAGGTLSSASVSLVRDAGPRDAQAFDVVEPACVAGDCLRACEQDCANGIDDDVDGATDCADRSCALDASCGAADTDGDGVANALDCRPDIGAAISRPGIVADLRVRRLRAMLVRPELSWTARTSEGTGTTVDVVKGRLDDLRADRGTRRAACAAQGVALPSFIDTFAYLETGGLWYLVRAENACGAGIWESRDLDGAGVDCP